MRYWASKDSRRGPHPACVSSSSQVSYSTWWLIFTQSYSVTKGGRFTVVKFRGSTFEGSIGGLEIDFLGDGQRSLGAVQVYVHLFQWTIGVMLKELTRGNEAVG
ncbi:hypothetical protein V6N13_038890 [Hibiscus sabdariffa]